MVLTRFFLGGHIGPPLRRGVVVPRFVGADRCVCPLLFAVYILSPCLRGTSNRVAEGVYYVFACGERTRRSVPTLAYLSSRQSVATRDLFVVLVFHVFLFASFERVFAVVCSNSLRNVVARPSLRKRDSFLLLAVVWHCRSTLPIVMSTPWETSPCTVSHNTK